MRYRLDTMPTTPRPRRLWAAGAMLALAAVLGLLGTGAASGSAPAAAGPEPGAAVAGAALPVSERSVLGGPAAPVAPLADRRGERERPGPTPVAVLAAAAAGAALAGRLSARSPTGRLGRPGRSLRASPRGPPRLQPAWT
jgi:hypothetical protein